MSSIRVLKNNTTNFIQKHISGKKNIKIKNGAKCNSAGEKKETLTMSVTCVGACDVAVTNIGACDVTVSVVHYSLSLLVSWAFSTEQAKDCLCSSPNFDSWLKRLTLEAPEVTASADIIYI